MSFLKDFFGVEFYHKIKLFKVSLKPFKVLKM